MPHIAPDSEGAAIMRRLQNAWPSFLSWVFVLTSLLTLLVSTHPAVTKVHNQTSAGSSAIAHPEIEILSPNVQDDAQIRGGSYSRFTWTGDGTIIEFASFKMFLFYPPADGRYLVRYQSDSAILSLFVIGSDNKTLIQSNGFSLPPASRTVPISFSKGQEIRIVVGSVKVAKAVDFRIGVYSDQNLTLNEARSRDSAPIASGQHTFKFPPTTLNDGLFPVLFFKPCKGTQENGLLSQLPQQELTLTLLSWMIMEILLMVIFIAEIQQVLLK